MRILRSSRPCGQLHIEVELTIDACNRLKVDLSHGIDSCAVQQEVLRLHLVILPSISFQFESCHAGLVDLNVPDAAERAIALDVHVKLRFGDLLRSVRCEQVCDHPCMLFVFHEVQFDSWFELDHIRVVKVGFVLLLRIVDLLIRQPNRELEPRSIFNIELLHKLFELRHLLVLLLLLLIKLYFDRIFRCFYSLWRTRIIIHFLDFNHSLLLRFFR